MPETLYSKRDAFFLEIDTVDFKIREPVGWDKAEIAITRDREKHGITVDFPNKDVQLEFSNVPEEETGNRSKVLIDDKYALNGPDTTIYLKFGEWDGVTFTQISIRRLDLASLYKKLLHTTITKTTNENLQTLIEDYSETPMSMNQEETIFNEAMPGITPATVTPISLHSKAIRKTYEAFTEANTFTGTLNLKPGPVLDNDGDNLAILIDQPSVGLYETNYLQIALPNVTKGGLLKSLGLPTGFSILEPLPSKRFNYELEDNGRALSAIVKVFFRMVARYSDLGGDVTFTTILSIKNHAYIIGTTVISTYNQTPHPEYIDHSAVIDLSSGGTEIADALRKGDEVYLYTTVALGPVIQGALSIKSLTVYENDNACQFQMVADTFYKPSVINGHKLFDALEYAVRAITGRENAFKSEFYTNGDGEARVISNGLRLRGQEDDTKAVTIDLDSSFDSLQMIDGIGQAFIKDNTGEWVLMWERIDRFYTDNIIANLIGKTSDFELSSDKLSLINEIRILYPRLTVREDNGANTIDEYNSEMNSVTPLKRAEGKMSMKSDWRASGYDTETARRLIEKPTESYQSDDDIFIFDYVPAAGFDSTKVILEFLDEDNQSQLYIYFKQTDFEQLFKYAGSIVIDGDPNPSPSANIDGTYTYDPVIAEKLTLSAPNAGTWYKAPAAKVVSSFTSPLALVAVDGVSVATPVIRAERNEAMSTLTGVIDPPSVYNIRMHPLRCLVNNALITNSALFYKDDTELYKTQFKKENRDLVTQRDISDSKAFGDTSRALMTEATGITKVNADGGRMLTQPNIVTFKAEISRDLLLRIIDAFTMEDDVDSYGYIVTLNNEGEQVSVYVDEITGLPNENLYTITGRLKGNYYDT